MQHNKDLVEQPTGNLKLSSERLSVFPLKPGTRQQSAGSSVQRNWKRERHKSHTSRYIVFVPRL